MKIIDFITMMMWLVICTIDLDYISLKGLIIGLILLSLFTLGRLYHEGRKHWKNL